MVTPFRVGIGLSRGLTPLLCIAEPNTVSYSQSSLIYLVGPSDCTLHGFVHGGKEESLSPCVPFPLARSSLIPWEGVLLSDPV